MRCCNHCRDDLGCSDVFFTCRRSAAVVASRLAHPCRAGGGARPRCEGVLAPAELPAVGSAGVLAECDSPLLANLLCCAGGGGRMPCWCRLSAPDEALGTNPELEGAEGAEAPAPAPPPAPAPAAAPAASSSAAAAAAAACCCARSRLRSAMSMAPVASPTSDIQAAMAPSAMASDSRLRSATR